MSGLSLRVRLVVWYLAILAPAMLGLAIGSEWLVRRSLTGAADAALTARIEGVRAFVQNAETEQLSPIALRDEFLEWAQLTNNDVLIEVTGNGGELFCSVARAGWSALAAQSRQSPPSEVTAHVLDGVPLRVKVDQLTARDNVYRVVVAVPMDQTQAAMASVHSALVLLVPSVLFAAAAGGYWISGRALAPVGKMTREVRAITVRSLERRVEVPHSDAELESLALTFNAMLARLETSVADLARLTADASHELRTPVTLVRTTAEVTLARDRSPAEYRDAITDILTHAVRMSALVDNLLALARADAGVEIPADETADLVGAATTAVEDMRSAAERAALAIRVDAADERLMVRGSAEALRRLLLILLSNSVRYTAPGGRIGVHVSADTAAQTARLEVVDTGIGIEPADRAHVFDRFYRGAAARATAADGSGLGLPIARALVTSSGGEIAIAETPRGGGCRVVVTLPLSR